MPLNELLPIAGALTAPAFFLLFALAALGAPLLAFVCLASGQLHSTQYIEAYSRRLLRMAFSSALPAVLALLMVCGLLAFSGSWVRDWLQAAPTVPALFSVAGLAFLSLLLKLRLSQSAARRSRQASPMLQAFTLSVLALAVLWLALALTHGLLTQAQAVVRAPLAEGLGVVPLISPDTSDFPPLFWTALAALVPLCTACAGTLSLEYLLLLRDREPFGREALTQMLRIAARCTLRSALLAAAFLPVLWTHLPKQSPQPDGVLAAQVMLGLAAGFALLLCLSSGSLARSGRPWARPLAVHLTWLCAWLCLASLLCVGMLCFYAA